MGIMDVPAWAVRLRTHLLWVLATLVSNLEVQCMAATQYMHMEVSNLNMRPNVNEEGHQIVYFSATSFAVTNTVKASLLLANCFSLVYMHVSVGNHCHLPEAETQM